MPKWQWYFDPFHWSGSNNESKKDAISFKQNRAHNEMKQNLKKFFIQGTFPFFFIFLLNV